MNDDGRLNIGPIPVVIILIGIITSMWMDVRVGSFITVVGVAMLLLFSAVVQPTNTVVLESSPGGGCGGMIFGAIISAVFVFVVVVVSTYF